LAIDIAQNQTEQERRLADKLYQAKVMGFAIIEDIQIKISNFEILTSEVSSTKAGIPYARMINSTKPVSLP
jgi:hypothetical protein